jgi:3D (Asp-Asp-Asp) domain-containing protein
MRKILFFMISVFLIFSSFAQSEQENNTSAIKNIANNSPETNNTNKTRFLRKTVTKQKKNIQISNNDIAPSKKIFLVGQANKNQINKDRLDYISIKENIKFPVSFQSTYAVKSGDTLGGIAKKFGVAQGEIQRLNPGVDFGVLSIGKDLVMPISQNQIDEIEGRKTTIAKKQVELEQKIIFTPSGNQLRVIASAYTSHASQTDGSPFVGAWGHRFSPGMQIVAVSNDLIREYGITNGTKIRIGGLDGYYTVRDKMNKRYRKHIDIYMGLDRARALKWGRRSVVIYW